MGSNRWLFATAGPLGGRTGSKTWRRGCCSRPPREPAVDHARQLLDVLGAQRFDDLDDHHTGLRQRAVADGGPAGQTLQPGDRLLPPARGEDAHGVGQEETHEPQDLVHPGHVAHHRAALERVHRLPPEPQVLESGVRRDAVEAVHLDHAAQAAVLAFDLVEQGDDDRVVVLARELARAPHAVDAVGKSLDPLNHPPRLSFGGCR